MFLLKCANHCDDKLGMRLHESVGNIVKHDGMYHLYMLVDGQWLETGISTVKLLEMTEIADREFSRVLINGPLTAMPSELKRAAA